MARSRNWMDDRAVKKAVKDDYRKRVQRAVIFVRDKVKRSINRGNATGDNPSAEGEPPKKVSGILFNSITGEVIEDGEEILGAVGTNVEYAPRLEFGFHGTDSNGRVVDQGERPYLRPGIQDNKDELKKILGVK